MIFCCSVFENTILEFRFIENGKSLAHRREGELFLQLLEMLKFYDTFEVDDLKGTSMSTKEVTAIHYQKIQGKLCSSEPAYVKK